VLSFFQLSPIFLVISMILMFRRPPVQAAVGGALLATGLWFGGIAKPFLMGTLSNILQDTMVLFMSTAFVIAPGLLFVIFLERVGANDALSEWVRKLGWPKAAQALFLVLGLAPLLEGMTGFGVSLIATVPLLIALVEKRIALRIALTGMCIMPWGTLGLATVIGAALAGMPADTLGGWSAWTSAPVFLGATLLALWLAGQRKLTTFGIGALFAALFIGLLHIMSRTLGPEIAGVGAAAAITLIGIAWAKFHLKSTIVFPVAAWPYVALLGTILVLKLINATFGLDAMLILQGAQVSWKPLASPGIALLIVDIVLIAKLGLNNILTPFSNRARRPLLTIFFFLFMSQLLVKAGFFDGVRAALDHLAPVTLAPLVAALGGLSGYITGSNVGGNAIVMPSVAHLGLTPAALAVMAAIQNSAAGHAALGSMPIVALILGLAKGSKDDEQELIRFAFLFALFNTVAVGTIGYFLMANAAA